MQDQVVKIALVVSLTLALDDDLAVNNRSSRLYNPIFNLVNFPNDPCIGSSTTYDQRMFLFWLWDTDPRLTGVCYSSAECNDVAGGLADGRCAEGFGVCCVIRWTFWEILYFIKICFLHRTTGCGGTVTQNSTHIQNPSYPAGSTDTTSCVYTFKKSSLDICSIRLDFVKFEVRGPDVNTSPYTTCSHDTVQYCKEVKNFNVWCLI